MVIENNLGNLWITKNLQYANEIFDQKCFLSIFQPKILNWLQKRSLVNLGFEMCSFFSIILFFFYILFFYAFSFYCFLIMLTTNHHWKGKETYIKKQTWNDFYQSPQFRPFTQVELTTLKKKSSISKSYEKLG